MKAENQVYLATWNHKHGADHSIHKSYEGAFAQLVQWAQDALEEWGEEDAGHIPVCHRQLIDNWPHISGGTEFLWVEDYTLND